MACFSSRIAAIFLSTLSLRRATISARRRASESIDFYPRSPCGERQPTSGILRFNPLFLSTLSLRRATYFGCYIRDDRAFLSTLSLRRATNLHPGYCALIHYFYPRSPCGERLNKRCKFSWNNRFLSTLSLRRATLNLPSSPIDKNISIHALLAESDNTFLDFFLAIFEFLSTLSLRRATHYDNYNLHYVEISIHALLAESDNTFLDFFLAIFEFLSTLSLRRATSLTERLH